MRRIDTGRLTRKGCKTLKALLKKYPPGWERDRMVYGKWVESPEGEKEGSEVKHKMKITVFRLRGEVYRHKGESIDDYIENMLHEGYVATNLIVVDKRRLRVTLQFAPGAAAKILNGHEANDLADSVPEKSV